MGRVTCERERGGWQQRTKFGKQIRFTGVGARHQMPHAYVGAFIYVCIYKHTDMYLLFGSACWFLAFRTLRLCVRFGFWKKLMNWTKVRHSLEKKCVPNEMRGAVEKKQRRDEKPNLAFMANKPKNISFSGLLLFTFDFRHFNLCV